jgi:hypothetical protein
VWSNLVEWLEVCFRGEVVGFADVARGAPRPAKAALAMFELAIQMKREGRKWEEVKVALDFMRKAVGVYDKNWLEDVPGYGFEQMTRE